MKIKMIFVILAFLLASCSSEETTTTTPAFDFKPFQSVGQNSLSVMDFFGNPFFLRMNTIQPELNIDLNPDGKTPLFFLITSSNIPDKTYCFSSALSTNDDGFYYAVIIGKATSVPSPNVNCSPDPIPFLDNDDSSFSLALLATDSTGVGPFMNQIVKSGLSLGIRKDEQTSEQTANIYDMLDFTLAMHEDTLLMIRPELAGFSLADVLPNGVFDISSSMAEFAQASGLTIDNLIPVASSARPDSFSNLTLVFDGNNKKIINFSRTAPSDILANGQGFGLFPQVSGGTIKNLTLELNGDVIGSSVATKVVPTGALAGVVKTDEAGNPSVLENITIHLNTHKVVSASDFVGGAVGSFLAGSGGKIVSLAVSNGFASSQSGTGAGGIAGVITATDTSLILEKLKTDNVAITAINMAGGTTGKLLLAQSSTADAKFIADKLSVKSSKINTTDGDSGGLFGLITLDTATGVFANPTSSKISQSFVLDTFISSHKVLDSANASSLYPSAGGLVGKVEFSALEIQDSYVNGTTSAIELTLSGEPSLLRSSIGGLVGQVKYDPAIYPATKLNITNAYSNAIKLVPTALITNANFAGGLLGGFYNFPGSLPAGFDGTGVLSVNNGYGLNQNMADSSYLGLYAGNSGLNTATAVSSSMLDGTTQMKCQTLAACQAIFVGFDFVNVWADPTKPEATNNQGSPALLRNPTN